MLHAGVCPSCAPAALAYVTPMLVNLCPSPPGHLSHAVPDVLHRPSGQPLHRVCPPSADFRMEGGAGGWELSTVCREVRSSWDLGRAACGPFMGRERGELRIQCFLSSSKPGAAGEGGKSFLLLPFQSWNLTAQHLWRMDAGYSRQVGRSAGLSQPVCAV